MKKFQIVSAVVLSASLGVVIPFGVPSHWLKYALGRGLIFALVGATLCLGRAEHNIKGILGVVSLLAIDTCNLQEKVRNHGALLIFTSSVLYLAGLFVGAFAAVS